MSSPLPTVDEVKKMKKLELQKLCEDLGLDGGGTVGEMREEIQDYIEEQGPPTKKAKKAPAAPKFKWQVKLGGNFCDLPEELSTSLEEAVAEGKASYSWSERRQVYMITFADNQQTNTTTPPYKKRQVRRVPADLAGAVAPPPPKPKPKASAPTTTSSSSSSSPTPGSPAVGEPEQDPNETPPDRDTAAFTLELIDPECEEFWDLEEKFNSHLQGRNEDYVSKRLDKKLKPVSFVLKAAHKIKNPVLEKRFQIKAANFKKEVPNKSDQRVRVSFHGTHPKNNDSICRKSLLPFGHTLNPCKTQVDSGYFGSNKKGIYVSRYADYTFKYANRQVPLEPGDTCKIVMFRTLPGVSKHIEKLCGPIDPTAGFHSHSSPSYLEWYLFHEDQALPDYLLTILAKEDTRTAADDM
eukprot:TRINITY_DN67656_c8_g6_i1.p1 TRINITY_DN67656_c8_g6~~TRINITY_DN67656_c8_g6_i1.p1  ORF type:complete len:409 (-),score=41.97 TRINITY_DN67656_c8_g6_i1:214-1440(-)